MEYLVNTPCGLVQGCAGRNGAKVFRGIRYATASRWEYPEQVTAWEGVYDATEFGKCCYQPDAFSSNGVAGKDFYHHEFREGETYEYSEDCLFLNIYTPKTAKNGDKLPVLIYIHGGAFNGGRAHEKHFRDPVWTDLGVIGVTIHYRLGPLGFLCLPDAPGNYGLYDQITAIKWIKDNISAFGGNPENITIMGQSAGAVAVQQLCQSPLTEGLFQKAVMSSGGGNPTGFILGKRENRYAYWQTFQKYAGCESVAQLRALTPKQILEAYQLTKKELKGRGYYPCFDGVLLKEDAKPHNIPYMIGATSEDIMMPELQEVAKQYADVRQKPSFIWHFNRQLPGDDKGAFHTADIWYWFGTLERCWRPMTKKDYQLSNIMAQYLCNFASVGNPNGKDLPEWKPSEAKMPEVMLLGEQETGMGVPHLQKENVPQRKGESE